MVGQSGRKLAGRRKRFPTVEGPGLKADSELKEAAKRKLAFRRFWLFLLTAVLLAIGIASACGVRLF